jgi:hypothetical protein
MHDSLSTFPPGTGVMASTIGSTSA